MLVGGVLSLLTMGVVLPLTMGVGPTHRFYIGDHPLVRGEGGIPPKVPNKFSLIIESTSILINDTFLSIIVCLKSILSYSTYTTLSQEVFVN
jgi:hypothetical protein